MNKLIIYSEPQGVAVPLNGQIVWSTSVEAVNVCHAYAFEPKHAQLFIQDAIDPIIVSSGQVRLIPIQSTANPSAKETTQLGVDAQAWDTVHAALFIVGMRNNALPHIEAYSWSGSRSAFKEGQLIADAQRYAKERSIYTPTIFTRAELVSMVQVASLDQLEAAHLSPSEQAERNRQQKLADHINAVDHNTHPLLALSLLEQVKSISAFS